ncbi:MAG: hypothetical protein ABID38_01970 [Candidatus Diapherotrites archaeon]
MPFLTRFRIALRDFANKVLAIDDTQLPRDQVNLLKNYVDNHRFNTNTSDLKDLMQILKKKHEVDSIIVSKRNGSMVASSNGNDLNEAVMGTALFNYIRSELPQSQSIMIKSDDWYMLFPSSEMVYIVRAPASLAPIELNAISKDVEKFLSKAEEITVNN